LTGREDIAARLADLLGGDSTRIDTHAASIILAGHRAWKLKRPVCLPYLDFSTPDKRRQALEAELDLNRRTAPELYLGVHPLTRSADGVLALDGDGPPVDWVLEMKRFPDDALLADYAARDAIDDGAMLRLADAVAAFHDEAETQADGEGAARIRQVVEGNDVSMATFPDILDPAAARALTGRLLGLIEAHAALLDGRARGGRVRHGHGDLHLRNIAMIDGTPVPFDCLEFDRELATTDVLYDLAFLLMDLWERGARHPANIVFNRYLDLSPEDEAGVALIPLMLSIRACVRAHVMAAQAKPDAARRYLDLAGQFLDDVPARLVAIGGLSGSGKSTVARAIGSAVGRAPGARILRSDVLRKRIAGVAPERKLDKSAYTPQASAAVYAELGRLARQALAAGQSVIADAVFGTAEERAAIEGCGAPFLGFWLALPEEKRIERIAGRGPDASDADAAVARMQSRALDEAAVRWRAIPSEGGVGAVAERILGWLSAPESG
jgi:aminoglycoside phosphotransferase family enzyme/predicted kinase